MSEIFQHALPNGLRLVAEPIEGTQSCSLSLLTPAGVVYELPDRQGQAAILAEMICRGAGKLDARRHSDALDQLGVQRSTSVETTHLRVAATMLASRLGEAMPLILDMARRPMLEESALEPSRDLALQSLESLEDEPQQKVFVELKTRHYPQPLGRSALGRKEDLERVTIQDVRGYWRNRMVPRGAILGVAGKFDWPKLRDQVESLLGDWQGDTVEPRTAARPARGYHHVHADTQQVHLGVAYDAVPEPDGRSMLQRAAVAVLSGGMSGRLFTQVREKRGLCYSVFASYAGQKNVGAVLGYAGTTAPRAQETLDVLWAELQGLSRGVERDEFDRAIVGMKSRIVMQGESTSARASAIAADQHIRGRPRTMAEVTAQVDAVRLEALNDFIATTRLDPATIVTIGPTALRPPGAG